jgi:hypothetical protein
VTPISLGLALFSLLLRCYYFLTVLFLAISPLLLRVALFCYTSTPLIFFTKLCFANNRLALSWLYWRIQTSLPLARSSLVWRLLHCAWPFLLLSLLSFSFIALLNFTFTFTMLGILVFHLCFFFSSSIFSGGGWVEKISCENHFHVAPIVSTFYVSCRSRISTSHSLSIKTLIGQTHSAHN